MPPKTPKPTSVRLTRTTHNDTGLRTEIVEGFCVELPEVGQSFTMFAKGLSEDGSIRYVKTSEVIEIAYVIDESLKNTMTLKTLNNSYLVEVLS